MTTGGEVRRNVVLERLLARAGWTPENLGDRLNELAAALGLGLRQSSLAHTPQCDLAKRDPQTAQQSALDGPEPARDLLADVAAVLDGRDKLRSAEGSINCESAGNPPMAAGRPSSLPPR
ncbi:MAG: hypothetical protein ACRDS0_33340 [Pseudonocardiaceae bacterium]